jgi:protein TonB
MSPNHLASCLAIAVACVACSGPKGATAVDTVTLAQHSSACVPAYPRDSVRLGQTGSVLVKAFIEADGTPTQVHVERSSGSERLDTAAVAAVTCFKFVPGKVKGTPTPMWFHIPIRFEVK